jgi:hypothetical protein
LQGIPRHLKTQAIKATFKTATGSEQSASFLRYAERMQFVKIGKRIVNLEQIQWINTFEDNIPSWVDVCMTSGEKLSFHGKEGSTVLEALRFTELTVGHPPEAVGTERQPGAE